MSSSSVVGKPAGYHHGDLPNALKAAAVEVIAEKGPAGFSLREVARRAGVSHAAPAHHFGDMTGLLTAVAVDAFRLLDEAMVAAADGAVSPADRLARVGRAYVEVGLDNPAHLDVVFRPDLVDTQDPAYDEWGERTYRHLLDALEAIRDELNPDLDIDDAARLCWATVQGLVVLHPGMSRRDAHQSSGASEIGDLAERFVTLILDGIGD